MDGYPGPLCFPASMSNADMDIHAFMYKCFSTSRYVPRSGIGRLCARVLCLTF